MPTVFPAFPTYPGITWPVKRSPAGRTIRQEALQGGRTLLPQMVTPRWSWELSYEFLRSVAYGGGFAELEGLTGFYLAQMMSGACFAYTDDEDNAANQIFGYGDGATTQFQLVRTRGGFTEPVLLPAITEVTVATVPTTAYTLGDKGILTFASAPASGAALGWIGSFAWLCRFDADSLDLSRFMAGLSEAKSLKFSNEIDP